MFLVAAALALGLDQLTKAFALAALAPDRPVPLLGQVVRLSLVHNAGAAFGLLPPAGLLVLVGLLFCLAIPFLLVRRPDLPRLQAAMLGLIWGGSAGNLLDRVRTGAVVDFIDLRVWPVFNVADIAITVGFVVLAAQLLFRRDAR